MFHSPLRPPFFPTQTHMLSFDLWVTRNATILFTTLLQAHTPTPTPKSSFFFMSIQKP